MVNKVKVKIKTQFLNDKMVIPQYMSDGAAGFDLQANLLPEQSVRISPSRGQVVIPTGIFVAIPEGYELQIRPRSGLAAKHGITIVNSPGTIDSDYRGEIGIVMSSMASPAIFTYINPGDRIAQAVLGKVEQVDFEEVDALDDTERGAGGFGSTGVETHTADEIVDEKRVFHVDVGDVSDDDVVNIVERFNGVVEEPVAEKPKKKSKPKKTKMSKKMTTGADLNKKLNDNTPS